MGNCLKNRRSNKPVLVGSLNDLGAVFASLRVMAKSFSPKNLTGPFLIAALALMASLHAQADFYQTWDRLWSQFSVGFKGSKSEISWQELVPNELRKMPLGIQHWYVLETDFLSRKVNTSMIASPEQNDQLRKYTPEAKRPFNLIGYWIPTEYLHIYKAQMPAYLGNQFFREIKGKQEVLFLIHPESKDAYPGIVNGGFEREIYRALATASSRSLLVWKPGNEQRPFIAKVSLYKQIGHVVRSVLASETAYGVSVTKLLHGPSELPRKAIFMDEVLGVIPKGMSEGGMILRPFPPEILTQKNITYAPLFSLYSRDDDSRKGLLLEMLQESGEDPRIFLRKNVIRPFIEIWKTLAVDHGITMEPHAQNVLVEMIDGKLTGRFVFRDNGGFNIDEDFRKKVGMYVPPNFKNFGDHPTGNFAGNHDKFLQLSLSTYFAGGFLFSLDQAVLRWIEKGWLQADPRTSVLSSGWAEEILHQEIKRALSNSSDSYVGYSKIPELIKAKRAQRIQTKPSPIRLRCGGIYIR